MGSKPVRLIKSSGLARMAHRTTNARRSGLFLRPRNEHVILGRGTSDRANTRRRWMASSPQRGLSWPIGVAPVCDRQDGDDPRPVIYGVQGTVIAAPGGQDFLERLV